MPDVYREPGDRTPTCIHCVHSKVTFDVMWAWWHCHQCGFNWDDHDYDGPPLQLAGDPTKEGNGT